jgi:hypothetical protein
VRQFACCKTKATTLSFGTSLLEFQPVHSLKEKVKPPKVPAFIEIVEESFIKKYGQTMRNQ